MTLILGSLLNGYNTLKLEERKFEFSVQKSVLDRNLDARGRTALLCEMVDLGLLRDDGGRYKRLVVDGDRPCGPPAPTGAFSTRRSHQELIAAVGERDSASPGIISLERGFIKSNERAVPYQNLRDHLVQAAPISSIVVEYFDHPVTTLTRAQDPRVVGDSPTTHVLILRDGRMIQLNNLFVRNGSSAIRISLTNTGPLRSSTNPHGERIAMRGQGEVEAKMEDVITLGSPRRHHQRFTIEQIETLHALLYGFCSLADGSPTITFEPYVSTTLAAQGEPLPAVHCPARSADPLGVPATAAPAVAATPSGV